MGQEGSIFPGYMSKMWVLQCCTSLKIVPSIKEELSIWPLLSITPMTVSMRLWDSSTIEPPYSEFPSGFSKFSWENYLQSSLKVKEPNPNFYWTMDSNSSFNLFKRPSHQELCSDLDIEVLMMN